MEDFWSVVYDERDIAQWKRFAEVWRLSARGELQHTIAGKFGIDQALVSRTLSGFKWRPNLVQMYLVQARIGRPQEGWKWILECTPKPTNRNPRALQIPDRIRAYQDILEFLDQFPPISEESEALRSFGLTSEWAKKHKAELFWFLLGFFVGDAGKYYADCVEHARHYRKTAMNTRMTDNDSNSRVLRYIQVALASMGIQSRKVQSEIGVLRWHSEATEILTWFLQVCAGLREGQRTSLHRLDVSWLLDCPANLIVSFLQGLADSDGSVDKHGYYVDIASIPNSAFFKELFDVLQVDSHLHPEAQPTHVRIYLAYAVRLHLFNQTIRSYRYEQLIQHAIRRNLISSPPSLSFLTAKRT